MRQTLKLHQDSTCQAISRIDVVVSRPNPGTLILNYSAIGAIAGLVLPPIAEPVQADDLWQHTCFEAFVRGSSGEGYYEFNFSPSTQWAAYRFKGYRAGMTARCVAAPAIAVETTDQSIDLQASLDLAGLSDLPEPWLLGISAVIEETNGRNSYWALAHPPGKADFHHPDCFVLKLPPA